MNIIKYLPALCLFSISFIGCAQKTDSLDFKIGQMIIVGYAGQSVNQSDQTLSDIARGRVGGIILFEKNVAGSNSEQQIKQLIADLKNPAPVPLFMALDHEGGRVNRLKEKYGFPRTVSAKYLGNLGNPDSVAFYGEVYASTLSRLGFNVNFAPVVDLEINKQNPVIAQLERSYAANPDSVSQFARIMIDAHERHGLLPVLKHFPGHGSSHSDTHKGIADVTDYWQKQELEPYKNLINKGKVKAIMTAHIVNKKLDPNGLPGTLSAAIVNDLLRDSLRFNGLVFSDDMQMHAITKYYGLNKAIEYSISAGVDVLIFSNNIQGSQDRTIDTVHAIIKRLVNEGKISPQRIEESYKRIVAIKSTLE